MAFDDATVAAFEQWSVELGELYVAWTRTNRQFAHGPKPNSPAAQEDAVLAAAFPKLTLPEGSGAGFDAVQMIDAAAQHMLGLKALVDSRTMALAPWPAARAVAEHIAHAAWLLEPRITPEARMARRWMARLAAAHRMRWVAKTSAQTKAARKTREQFRADLLTRFPDVDTTWDNPANEPEWEIGGESYAGLGRTFKAFAAHEVTGTTDLYGTLSLFSHPNIVAVSSLSERTDQGDHIVIGYRVDTDAWGSLVHSATSLVCIAAQAACNYLGCKDDALLRHWVTTYRAS
ncbi:hypothetical protein [Nocardia abscessus]|uniref:hypothetical protein n=1 Tax=Nocardia abscessus TaxID=120957 RepID=UPI002454F434|nr:hypothetical protein [Nocardia abscessus]